MLEYLDATAIYSIAIKLCFNKQLHCHMAYYCQLKFFIEIILEKVSQIVQFFRRKIQVVRTKETCLGTSQNQLHYLYIPYSCGMKYIMSGLPGKATT